jgi:DNA-binding HxlR family transcriptional regulator
VTVRSSPYNWKLTYDVALKLVTAVGAKDSFTKKQMWYASSLSQSIIAGQLNTLVRAGLLEKKPINGRSFLLVKTDKWTELQSAILTVKNMLDNINVYKHVPSYNSTYFNKKTKEK